MPALINVSGVPAATTPGMAVVTIASPGGAGALACAWAGRDAAKARANNPVPDHLFKSCFTRCTPILITTPVCGGQKITPPLN
jgi:hypothetical protein